MVCKLYCNQKIEKDDQWQVYENMCTLIIPSSVPTGNLIASFLKIWDESFIEVFMGDIPKEPQVSMAPSDSHELASEIPIWLIMKSF